MVFLLFYYVGLATWLGIDAGRVSMGTARKPPNLVRVLQFFGFLAILFAVVHGVVIAVLWISGIQYNYIADVTMPMLGLYCGVASSVVFLYGIERLRRKYSR